MRRSQYSRGRTTRDKAEKYDNLMPLLQSMSREFQELSKKKPDGFINKRKVEIVNRLLRDIHQILNGEPTIEYLDLLDEDDLPQNSDVNLILSQTVAAMATFWGRYREGPLGGEEWAIEKE